MADSKAVRTVRVSDEHFDALVRKYGSLGAALEAALVAPRETTERAPDSTGPVARAPHRRKGGKTSETWPYPEQVAKWENLMLPVGDIIAGRLMWTWPINPALHTRLDKLFEPWRVAGFMLVWGPAMTEPSPCVNSRMQPYFPGDQSAWCEVSAEADLDQCLSYLKANTQVLVPMMTDLERYGSSPLYKLVCDTYARYYREYFKTGIPADAEE